MMKRGDTGQGHRESGMSEVVGFIMILGLIMTAASLYLTYGVPSQGRENEIVHMSEVSDQFVAYKLSLDGLYANNMIGTTTSNAFSLGTATGHVTGQMIILPVMNPVGSGGVMAINQRYSMPETLNISSHSLIRSDSLISSTSLPAQYSGIPDHIYVNISGIQSSDLTSSGTFGARVNGSTWKAYINITPQMTYYQIYTKVDPDNQDHCLDNFKANGTPIYVSSSVCLVPFPVKNYTQSDIQLSIVKNNVKTMENFPVYRKVQVGPAYAIDLMDPAYGLNSFIPTSDTIIVAVEKSQGSIAATGNISMNQADMTSYVTGPIPLGAVEYRSVNNYWINQNYYYQSGAIILQQTGTGSTFKQPPTIGFTYGTSPVNASNKLVSVGADILTIDQNDWDLIGGNSPVKLKTTLTNITPFPYGTNTANTEWVRIGFNTTEPEAGTMWMNYLNLSAINAGIPTTQILTGTTGNETWIQILDNTSTPGNDISLRVAKATYSVKVHGVS